MNVTDAEKIFVKLVNKVYAEGIGIDLERDHKVIARLTPAMASHTLTIGELNAFLNNLPSPDDADTFARDINAVRSEFLPEISKWE